MTTSIARALAAGAAIMGLGAVMVGAADPPRGAFGVGALRRDSVVVPFASFDGKRWSSAWPPPGLELTVPIDLRAVPSRWWGPTRALESWQAWTAPSPLMLRVVQPDWVDVHCVRQIGLRTDYLPSTLPPPRTEQPYPKDGLAVSPPQPVERAEIVPSSADEVRSFTRVLTQAFNEAERLVEQRHGHPVARRAREGVEPTIEAVYAFGASPRVYYVEANRRYRELGQFLGECAALAFGTGWFVRDEAGVRPLTMGVDLLPCDRSGASYMLPLGVMRVGGRLFWIAQFSGWDHERFVVIEIKAKTVEVAVSVWGGGC
ncbi:MAG: hypothetical protein DMD48_14180 [Gemmatimonadetes bacterium]|nr:MAG: hypothetical protein DMD48_14180 [Gemmatimonadota bacterium]